MKIKIFCFLILSITNINLDQEKDFNLVDHDN